MTKRTLLTLLILVSLAFASYAAWQETKTALGVGVIASPSGDGTFQMSSARCDEVIPGEQSYCEFYVKNRSSGPIHVDDFSVTVQSGDVVIDDVRMWLRDIAYEATAWVTVEYHVPPDALPGVFVFHASVTCSGQ